MLTSGVSCLDTDSAEKRSFNVDKYLVEIQRTYSVGIGSCHRHCNPFMLDVKHPKSSKEIKEPLVKSDSSLVLSYHFHRKHTFSDRRFLDSIRFVDENPKNLTLPDPSSIDFLPIELASNISQGEMQKIFRERLFLSDNTKGVKSFRVSFSKIRAYSPGSLTRVLRSFGFSPISVAHQDPSDSSYKNFDERSFLHIRAMKNPEKS